MKSGGDCPSRDPEQVIVYYHTGQDWEKIGDYTPKWNDDQRWHSIKYNLTQNIETKKIKFDLKTTTLDHMQLG